MSDYPEDKEMCETLPALRTPPVPDEKTEFEKLYGSGWENVREKFGFDA